jgi:phosphoglycerol transferase MdoB-like AlkP superfamily enzyme
MWLGIVLFAGLFVTQLLFQRNDRAPAKWLGGGLIVLGCVLWVVIAANSPGIRPVGLIVNWLENRIFIP